MRGLFGGTWRRKSSAAHAARPSLITPSPSAGPPPARSAQGRMGVQLLAAARREQLDLPILPGDGLLVVPADLNAGIGRRRDAVAIADDGIVRRRLVDVDDFREAVVVGLRFDCYFIVC